MPHVADLDIRVLRKGIKVYASPTEVVYLTKKQALSLVKVILAKWWPLSKIVE
jgi:hypothetical protein